MLPTHRPPTHPGEMLLKEFLEPLGVSQAEAAARMSIPFQRLNGIVKGRRAVSADTALLLDALTARGRRPKVRPLRKTAQSPLPVGQLSDGDESTRRSGVNRGIVRAEVR